FALWAIGAIVWMRWYARRYAYVVTNQRVLAASPEGDTWINAARLGGVTVIHAGKGKADILVTRNVEGDSLRFDEVADADAVARTIAKTFSLPADGLHGAAPEPRRLH